jgi:hypothetical protein
MLLIYPRFCHMGKMQMKCGRHVVHGTRRQPVGAGAARLAGDVCHIGW